MVIKLKIFILTKRKLFICCLSFFIILIACFLYVMFSLFTKLEMNLTCNAVTSFNEFENKIKQLCKGDEKIVYLTFDDGPSTSTTPEILDILKEENVKATFFVIGKLVGAHPEIVKRAYEEGHYIANHSYDHNNDVLYKSKENFVNEIKRTDEAIGKAIGIEDYCSHVFRFPNGFMAPKYKMKKKEMAQVLPEMNYTYIDWNCLNNDSVQKYTKEQLIDNLKKSSKNKKTLVILMHDTKDVSDSSSALKESIHYLKTQGYQFENFYHLM